MSQDEESEEESDEESVAVDEESDERDEESMDESDEDTDRYGEEVDTLENPKFSVILSLASRSHATSAHVTGPKGETVVYMLGEVGPRNKLKDFLQKKRNGYSWIVRKNKSTEVKGKSKKGLAKGFDPDPSSEEDESENESDEEEEEEIAPKEGKKARSKVNSCKPPSDTKRKKPKDDDESCAKKGLKPKRTSKTTTKARGTGAKSRGDTKSSGGKKTSKGKQSREGKNDSDAEVEDDDSVDFGDPNMKDNLHKQIEEKSKALLPVYVSSPFHDVVGETLVYGIFFGKPNNSFMCKAPHQKAIVTHCHKKRITGNSKNVPKWIGTIVDLKVCKVEHGQPSVWYKTTSGNTSEIIHFVVTVPEDEGETFHDTLDDIITNFFIKGFKARKKNPAGELALAYTEGLADNSQANKGLYNWCVRVKGGKDPVVAARVMTKEIDEHFSGGPAFNYDVALDKYMVEWDIKQFLNDHVGINSWDDLNEDGRKACFRDYPKRELPEWELIMAENY